MRYSFGIVQKGTSLEGCFALEVGVTRIEIMRAEWEGVISDMSRVAVVTGAASGIGQAVAERLARDDCAVVILDINEEGGSRVQPKSKNVADKPRLSDWM